MAKFRTCPNCDSNTVQVRYTEEPFYVVKCRQCDLVFLGNPPDEERLYEKYYDGEDDTADLYRSDSPDHALRELYHINRQRVQQVNDLKSHGRLLDIGCGNGFFLRSLHEYSGLAGAGIDVADRAVQYACREFNIDAQVATLDDLTGRGTSYDIITLWHVLEHFTDPFYRLEQIRSLLNPEGIIICEVPNLRSLKFILSNSKWEGGNHPRYHRTFFTAGTLKRTFRSADLNQVRRLPLTYSFPWRNSWFERLKLGLNYLGLDAFLCMVGSK